MTSRIVAILAGYIVFGFLLCGCTGPGAVPNTTTERASAPVVRSAVAP